jgi:hypothetical protein
MQHFLKLFLYFSPSVGYEEGESYISESSRNLVYNIMCTNVYFLPSPAEHSKALARQTHILF